MDLKNFYIGIDSGGTKCRVALGDGSGKIIHLSEYDSVHYSQAGTEGFSDRISSILDEFCGEISLDLKSVSGICLGAAGARSESDRRRVKDSLSSAAGFTRINVETDSAIAHYSAFGEGDGLVLISGTGSVLFGKYEGKGVRIGGWGKIIGDAGSSYAVSLGMLKRLAAHIDGSEIESAVEKRLREDFGITRENIIEEIYHKNFIVHSLAPLVVGLAEEGDTICSETVSEEIGGLAGLLRAFVKKYSPSRSTGLAFHGSVIDNDNFFSRTFREKIGAEFGKTFEIKEGKINALKGALKIAVKTFA